MTEKTTRTCDGCGANLASDYTPHWVLTYEGFGVALCQSTADKHLCTACVDRLHEPTTVINVSGKVADPEALKAAFRRKGGHDKGHGQQLV